MERAELFEEIYREILDYSDSEVLSRSANWGLDVFKMIDENGYLLSSVDADKKSEFIYGLCTAIIVAEFGNRAFGDHNLFDEKEIYLENFGLKMENVVGYLNNYPNFDAKRLEILTRENYVNVQDMWKTIWEYIKEIHKSLSDIYKKQGITDSDYAIYGSLLKVFEEKNEEGESLYPTHSGSGELSAYAYVSAGFQY